MQDFLSSKHAFSLTEGFADKYNCTTIILHSMFSYDNIHNGQKSVDDGCITSTASDKSEGWLIYYSSHNNSFCNSQRLITLKLDHGDVFLLSPEEVAAV